jgi:hypothetical protein
MSFTGIKNTISCKDCNFPLLQWPSDIYFFYYLNLGYALIAFTHFSVAFIIFVLL